MNIETRTRRSNDVAEIIIDFGNAKVTEDVASYKVGGGYSVEDKVIEQLISAAFDFSRFNSNPDEDTVLKIIEAFLSDSEKNRLIEKLQESNETPIEQLNK